MRSRVVLKFFSLKSFSFFIFSVFLLFIFEFRTLYAAADLTEEEKAQRRLQFNSYVEEELARAAQAKAADVEKAGPQFFFNVEPSVTYDSNANLNSKKQSALYNELRSEFGFKATRPERALLGAGQWGMSASLDRVDYHHFDTLDTTDGSAKAFITSRLGYGLTLKVQYEFESLYYPDNDQLDFLSHKIRPELFHEITKNFGHYVYGSIRFKDYVDRRALTAANSAGDDYRSDVTYEPGYGWKIHLGDETLLGLSAVWQKNDSNDLFDRYNDTRGYKIGGHLYRQLWDRASIVGLGGYDYKDYDARKFRAGSPLIETDHFFYLGSYLYLDLSKRTQFVASYLYKQNHSSDPSQEYSGYLAALGLNVTI